MAKRGKANDNKTKETEEQLPKHYYKKALLTDMKSQVKVFN